MNPGLAGGPTAGARLRLFCFHHAGGGAAAFAGWRDAFGPDVDVVPIRLPGRELRMREARITGRDRLIEELDRLLGPLLDRPYLLYGHSLGGLVAHAFTAHAADGGGPLPGALLVGASPAPHQDSALSTAAERGGSVLLRTLRDHGGIGDELLAHPRWLRLMLDVVRDDLRLAGALKTAAGAALPVPVHVFAGLHDRLAAPARLRGWARYTTAEFRLSAVPGGHFFHRDRGFTQLLAPVVRGLVPVAPTGGTPHLTIG